MAEPAECADFIKGSPSSLLTLLALLPPKKLAMTPPALKTIRL